MFDLTRSEVIAGQFLDVSVQARGESDVELAMKVLRYKSAKYSVERPLHLGATLAGADDATLAQLSAFGLPLGEAFQLRDDLLGVFGDPDVTGKPAGDAASWTIREAPLSAATPGRVPGADGVPRSVWISEFSDATGSGNFVFEFVELRFDGPAVGGDAPP